MNSTKKNVLYAVLVAVIFLITLFLLGDESFDTVTTTLNTLQSQSQTAAVVDFDSSLIAHYTFDDTANDSAGSNHVTLVGGPTYVDGKIGKALSFDGVDDYVRIGVNPSGIDTSAASVCAWTKKNDTSTRAVVSDTKFEFWTSSSGSKFSFTGNNSITVGSAANSLVVGVWQHACVTRSVAGTATNFYVNGSLSGTADQNSGTPTASIFSLNIGAYGTGGTGFFNGIIDDVRIYSTALTASQIAELYTAGQGAGGEPTNPVPTPAPTPTPTPTFTNPKTIVVVKTGTGQGTVTASAPGIDCGSDCEETYEAGSWIYLTATPLSGSAFAGWRANSCHTVEPDGRCRIILSPTGSGANVTAIFGLAAAGSGTTIAAATCESYDVQSAINKASDGYVVLVPAGTCTWKDPIGISNKSIILKGAGIDQTTIIGDLIFSVGLSVSVSPGKPVRVTGFTFEGNKFSANYTMLSVSGPPGQPSFRIDNNKFSNITNRGIIVNGAYGLIDHNILIRKPDGASPTLISVFGGDYDDSWLRPQDMGTSNAVFMEDNIFVHNIGANGPFDMYRGARYVFRDNNVYGNHMGHHGFDSDFRGEVNFEVYNNCIVNAAPRDQSPYILHPYSDCSVNPLPATTAFKHDLVFEFRSGSGVVFDNTVTRVPTSNNGGYSDSFILLRNYRSGDGYISNYGGTSWNGTGPGNGVCNGTNPLDGNTLDMDTNGDGVFDKSSGYPCKDQIGRTSGFGPDGKQTLSPVYSWNNNFQGKIGGNIGIGGYATFMCPKTNSVLVSKNDKPASGEPYSWVCKDTITGINHTLTDQYNIHIVEGRDYFNDIPKPGYTPYQYPHPLQVSGFTSDAGGSVITVPVGIAAPTIPQSPVAPTVLVIPPLPVVPAVVPPVAPTIPIVPNIPAIIPTPQTPITPPSLISRFIPSFTSTKPTTPSNVTKPKIPGGPFVPLPEVSPEEISTTPRQSFTEQVRSIFSYIVERIQNGLNRILGR